MAPALLIRPGKMVKSFLLNSVIPRKGMLFTNN